MEKFACLASFLSPAYFTILVPSKFHDKINFVLIKEKPKIMSTKEKNFLQELEELLTRYSEEIRTLKGTQEEISRVKELLQDAIAAEKLLREKHEIGVRFHVLRSQLQANLEEFEKELALIHQSEPNDAPKHQIIAEDEMLIYVYLFNSFGNKLKSWENLLLGSSLQEHNVNRPIYTDITQVEEVLRTRASKEQHAYIEMVIKKTDLLSENKSNDYYQHSLAKLREGSLKPEKIRRFHHNNIDYQVINEKLVPVK